MTEALIISGGFLLGLGLMFVAAMMLRDAERRCADHRVDAATKAGQIAIATAETATWKGKADDERQRADALDDELDAVAASGDVAGARARVLRRWSRGGNDPDATDGSGAGSLPAPAAAGEPGSGDGLLAPGE